MTIIADSSFIYALYNANDSRHGQALAFARVNQEPTIIPDVTLPEVSFLFLRDLGHEGVRTFLNRFQHTNATLLPLLRVDLVRMREIADTYASARFDLVDCCIMAQSERLNLTKVVTFDRRDFRIFRPRHTDYLELLP